MRSAAWQVRGIDPEAREAALVAAHSVGMSLGEWLTSVIHDKAAEQGVGDTGAETYAQGGEGLAAITERLDDLSRQLSRLEGRAPPRPDSDAASNRIADAILQLNGRLDQVIDENRSASSALERRVNSVDRALAKLGEERLRVGYVGGEPSAPRMAPRMAPMNAPMSAPMSMPVGAAQNVAKNAPMDVDDAVGEIAARQRALDGEFAAPPPAALQRPPFSPIHCRADAAVDGLRKDLAEIGRTLSEAMPRRAVEALEGEVRALVSKLDARLQAGADAPALAGLEQGLRDVRDALRGLAPAESLGGFDAAVQSLAAKIDRIATGQQDPAGLQPLEAAIAS